MQIHSLHQPQPAPLAFRAFFCHSICSTRLPPRWTSHDLAVRHVSHRAARGPTDTVGLWGGHRLVLTSGKFSFLSSVVGYLCRTLLQSSIRRLCTSSMHLAPSWMYWGMSLSASSLPKWPTWQIVEWSRTQTSVTSFPDQPNGTANTQLLCSRLLHKVSARCIQRQSAGLDANYYRQSENISFVVCDNEHARTC